MFMQCCSTAFAIELCRNPLTFAVQMFICLFIVVDLAVIFQTLQLLSCPLQLFSCAYLCSCFLFLPITFAVVVAVEICFCLFDGGFP